MVSILNAARDLGRVRDISGVLARHGFGEVAARLGLGANRKAPSTESPEESDGSKLGIRIRKVLEELGPSFVKLGQIMSTRSDILPAEVISELRRLQDDVPPVSFDAIVEAVERSLGARLDEIYSSFDERPLAAASIAQVHRATLRSSDGPIDVVVKVQRPGIQETIASDLDLLHTFATLLERAIPETRLYSPSGLVQQFDRAVTSELDFTLEAENAGRFSDNFRDFRNVRFPKVHREASTKHVLTLEYLDGQKVFDAVKSGHSPRRLARLALDIIVKQVFEDGFFHADPHPGNVLVLGTPDEPIFALLDLGMVGRLSPKMRDLAVDLMVAAARQDYDGVADAIYAIGTPAKKVDMNAFRAEVAILADRYLGRQLKDLLISDLVRDLVQGARQFEIEIPMDFVLVGKAIMTIEGVGREIDPTFDVFEEAKPLFIDILKQRYSPERLGIELLRRLERIGGSTSNLPNQLGEVLDDLRLGRLMIRTTDPEIADAADRLGRRLYSSIVAAALLVSGAGVISADYPRVGGALIAVAVLALGVHLARDTARRWRR
jgi:ubiquinone biosynthesis protein